MIRVRLLQQQRSSLWLAGLTALIASLASVGCAVPGEQSGTRGASSSPSGEGERSYEAHFDAVETRPTSQLDLASLTVDDLMDVAEDEPVDAGLASAVMAYEAGFATRDDIRMTVQKLDELRDEVLRRRIVDLHYYDDLTPALRQRRDERNAKRLVEFIIERGFRFDETDPEGHDPRNLFLHTVLQRKQGYCVSLTKLAIALAQRVRVPVRAVRVPGHMFLRYDPHDDGTALDSAAVNFEMTAFGVSRPSTYYLNRYNVHSTALANGVYLQNLSVREMFSDVASNLGSLLYLKERPAEAIEWFERAVDYDGRNAQAYYNLGTAHARLEQRRDALQAFRKALEYDAGDYLSYCARGRLYIEAGDPTQGFDDLERAISLRPDEAHAYQLRGVLHAKREEYEKAEPDLLRALELDERDIGTVRNLVLLYLQTEQVEQALELREPLERLHDGDEGTGQLLNALRDAERRRAEAEANE